MVCFHWFKLFKFNTHRNGIQSHWCGPQWAAASASPVSEKNADSQVSPYACIWVSVHPPGALEVSAWSPGLNLKGRQTSAWLPWALLSSSPGEAVIAPALLFFSALRRSNDARNEKRSAEDRVHGNRKASLAHWQLAGPHPFNQGVLPISPAKLWNFQLSLIYPSLKREILTIVTKPSKTRCLLESYSINWF